MSCGEAKAWEKRFFDPDRCDDVVPQERDFMRRAGTAVGNFVLGKLHGIVPSHLLVLIGKGHNGGDALIAAEKILRAFPKGSVPAKLVFFAGAWDDLAPLTMDAYEDFLRYFGKVPTFFVTDESTENFPAFLPDEDSGIVIDGIYGHGFRPPLRDSVFKALSEINTRSRNNLHVAVDLPSGISDSAVPYYAFSADFTCATGILKTPLLLPENAKYVGRIVPLSVDFPCDDFCKVAADTLRVLRGIPQRRPVFCDKRNFGHVLIVGGSRMMPGALLLNVLAALRAGSGLVSVLCPESVHAAFASRAPGAMWIPCKEAEDGTLELCDTTRKFRQYVAKATAVLCGSGMGNSPDAQALLQAVASETPETAALILDADALRPEVLFALRRCGENVLLPHAGEFLRIGGNPESPEKFWHKNRVSAIALKGAYTQILSSGSRIYTSAGTSALARGGSGDVLAGMTAALFAERKLRKNISVETLLTEAVCWHGVAAQCWEAALGTRTADIASLPDFFADALLDL